MKFSRQLLTVVSLTLLISGCGVNKSIHVADGETVDGGRATVNGNVTIGEDCEVPAEVIQGRCLGLTLFPGGRDRRT